MGMLVSIARSVSGSKLGKWATKRAPQILIGTGIVSGAGAIVGTVYATKKTLEEIEVEKMRIAIEQNIAKENVKLSKKDIFKIAARNSIVPAASAVISVTSTVAGFSKEHGRALTYAALFSGAEGKLAAVEAEMIDKLGDKKVKEIRDGAAQRQIDSMKEELDKCVSDKPVEDASSSGKYKLVDPAFKVVIKNCTHDKFDLAVSTLDHALELAAAEGDHTAMVSLGDLYEELGLDPWEVPTAARNIVWKVTDTTNIGAKLSYGQHNGEPCYVLNYYDSIKPKWDDIWDLSSTY